MKLVYVDLKFQMPASENANFLKFFHFNECMTILL